MEKERVKKMLGRNFVMLVTILLTTLITKYLLYAIDETILQIEAQEIQRVQLEIKR